MSRNVLRIFVSSPGDVGEERVMTARVVQRLQGLFGQSVKLEPIIWEHEPMRATQHPQEQIPLPSECDIVVCLLWSRLGTRLPDKISAAGKTGTEWEFEEAARSFRDKKTPDLLVYCKTREVLASVDDETTYAEKKSQWDALSGFLTRTGSIRKTARSRLSSKRSRRWTNSRTCWNGTCAGSSRSGSS